MTHALEDILRARIFAIPCGYPDADDLGDLRSDPSFMLACGRLPESGDDLASQPTVSRWENALDLRTLLRPGYAMIDLWCLSHCQPPKHITLDIDDTVYVVDGHQQLSLFNAHYDHRNFDRQNRRSTRLLGSPPCVRGVHQVTSAASRIRHALAADRADLQLASHARSKQRERPA